MGCFLRGDAPYLFLLFPNFNEFWTCQLFFSYSVEFNFRQYTSPASFSTTTMLMRPDPVRFLRIYSKISDFSIATSQNDVALCHNTIKKLNYFSLKGERLIIA
jgi:hypothetical protein